jgi:glycosyltransferase involved in cell wall biosynthesis
MSSGRSPFHFLLALSGLVREVPGFKQDVRVVFVGEIDGENRRIIDQMRSELQLGDMIRCVGGVSHRKAISYMREFDLLLFIIGGSLEGCPSSRGCVSGKLYEYLAAGKPILALAEEGPVRELIEESRCGVFVDRSQVDRIKRAILDFNRKFKQGKLRTDANWDYIRNFERKRLTGLLANTLNQLSAENSR